MENNTNTQYAIIITFQGSGDDVEPIVLPTPSAITKEQRDALMKILERYTPEA